MNQRAEQARSMGQSLWYDNISRAMLRSGELAKLIEGGVITGITTNPTIFQKAVEGSDAYEAEISALSREGREVEPIYHELTVADVREAADLLRAVYDRTGGEDGYVSLEVLPRMADDEASTVAEALRLREAVGRPNVMIKVPGTAEGVNAFRTLTTEGVPVNVTLLFSLAQYEAVAQAWIEGLTARHARGQDVSQLASVASFFVSRVDNSVDARLEEVGSDAARAGAGKTGVANCRVVYRRFREIFAEPAFQSLAAAGARVQRVLWASTSTKNPAYPDTLYVDELLGADTVNTLPPATLEAFLDHGAAESATIESHIDGARAQLGLLEDLGIDLEAICQKLQDDGVAAFASSFDQLLESLAAKVEASRQESSAG